MARFVFLLIVVLSSFAQAQESSILSKLDDAKSRYDSAVEKLRESVMKHLDTAEDKARKKGQTNMLQMIERERNDFTDSNILPESTPNDLIKRNSTAIKSMRTSFEKAKKQLLEAKLDDTAAELSSQIDDFENSLFKTPDHAKRLINGSVWSGIDGTGTSTTYTVTERTEESVTIERDSVDGKGKIVVELAVNGSELAVTKVGYRGPTSRVDRLWRGGGIVKGEALRLDFSVESNGKRWAEQLLLKLK